MTVYVDSARIPATVGKVRGRWSHLTADTPEELHAFAAKIGLRREWFQARCKFAPYCPSLADETCRHFHYDVVEARRVMAIKEGAQAISMRQLGAILTQRAERYRKNQDGEA